MSRLMLIQNASDSISPPGRRRCARGFRPPGGGARTPAPQPQHVLKFDRADQVDHGAAHHPDRVRFVEAQRVHVVLADVLDEARGGIQPQPAAPVDVTHPQRPAALKHRGVPIGNGHQRFVQHHQAGPGMTATSSGARIGDTHTAALRDGVTTMRWPGLPGRLPRWRTLADIDGGRSAGPPPRRKPVNPRCGENTSRLDTESSSIGQSNSPPVRFATVPAPRRLPLLPPTGPAAMTVTIPPHHVGYRPIANGQIVLNSVGTV